MLNGSSPRVRGTVVGGREWHVTKRFIPARAGNGAIDPAEIASPTVHPRACGERLTRVLDNPDVIGSSPRVRGTALARLLFRPLYRFIPARAGNGAHRRRTPCP